MAKYYLLNVYNTAIKLYHCIKTNTNKMPRDDRYIHVHPMLRNIEEIMCRIAAANDLDIKSDTLEPAIKMASAMQITTRNLYELHLITEKGFSRIADNLESLKRQLQGWCNKYNGKGAENTRES